jgi:hypothetical protein
MKLKTYFATILLLSISTSSVLASHQADGDGVAAIKTETGYLIVWNQPEIHFSLGVNGKDVRPMTRPGTGSVAFNVDGVVFQVQTVAISEFLKNAKKQKLSDQAILIAHRDWESQYLEQTVGTKLNVTTAPQQLSNGNQALIWKYDKPKTKGSEQMYLTMVSGTKCRNTERGRIGKDYCERGSAIVAEYNLDLESKLAPNRCDEAARVDSLKRFSKTGIGPTVGG